MYTDKKNILQLVALLQAHGITKIVLCPGSRNIPIVHTLSNHPDFTCYAVTDERSAGYFAIGLTLNGGKPAAICCTSGTALLNLHPAVAEAFYQNVPLVVISADRPAAWIGQMDGQTLPQPGVFQSLVKKSVNLPEIHTDEDEWYCNRLINEALLEMNHHGKGPVHINVPISEPLFQFTTDTLPEVRVITRYQGLNVYDRDYNDLIDRMNKYQKRMIIVGQMNLIYLFEKRYTKLLYKHFAWLTEHIGNQTVPGIPVKIVRPDISLVLVDSLNKRLAFLEDLCRRLALSAERVHGRAEDLGRQPQYRESFDLVTARAVTNMRELAEFCLPMVKKGGCFAAMKGFEVEEELAQAKKAIAVLGGKVQEVRKYTLPDGGKRSVVVIKKIS